MNYQGITTSTHIAYLCTAHNSRPTFLSVILSLFYFNFVTNFLIKYMLTVDLYQLCRIKPQSLSTVISAIKLQSCTA